MSEQRSDLLPPALGHGSLQLARLGNGLAGHGQLQGEAPRVERRLCPRRSGLWRTRLEVMRVRQEGSDGRGHEGGIQERLEGTRLLGVDFVEAVHRLVEPDAEFDLPTYAVEVGDLQRAEPGGQVREEKAVALRGLDADKSKVKGLLRPAHMDVGINGPAIQDEDLRRDEGIEVRAGEELLGDLPTGDILYLRFPGVLEAEHEAHIMRFARPETRQTGIAKIGEKATAPPGLVDRQMPAVMLPGRAAMVPHWGTAADGEDCMDVDRRVIASPRNVLDQRIADRHRRGIHDVPVLHPAEGSWPIDLLRPCIRQGTLRQRRHTLFEGRVEPPRERRARDPWHLTLQVGAQDVCLIGAAWRPRRNDHGPHQHSEVQFALSLDHPALLAQAVNLVLRQHRLEDLHTSSPVMASPSALFRHVRFSDPSAEGQ